MLRLSRYLIMWISIGFVATVVAGWFSAIAHTPSLGPRGSYLFQADAGFTTEPQRTQREH
jgi:hypothetical protein